MSRDIRHLSPMSFKTSAQQNIFILHRFLIPSVVLVCLLFRGIPELPQIPDGVEVRVGEDRSQVRLPIFGNATELTDRIESRLSNRSGMQSSKGREQTIAATKLSLGELERMLREKMKNGYFSMKNLFLSYDLKENGTVARESFHRIVSTFLSMSISYSQFNRLMDRLGFKDAKFISFGDFFTRLKNQKKEQENEYPSWFQHDSKDHVSSNTKTASQFHAQLKAEAKKNLDNLLTKLDLVDKTHVVKLVFYDHLKYNGYQISNKEFEKLWAKYDEQHVGVMNVANFVKKLTKSNSRSNTSSRCDGRQTSCEERSGSYNDVHGEYDVMMSDRDYSISIERWLSRKFREGVHDMVHAFKEFEVDGLISRDHFVTVLRDYGMVLTPKKLDEFLERCGINNPQRGEKIDYKEFLKLFQKHDETGIVEKVRNNRNHKYHDIKNRPDDVHSIATSLSSVEGHLVHLFQKDYLALLDKFRKLDRNKTNEIFDIEFRAVLESMLSIKFTDSQFKEFLINVPRNSHGRIQYIKFLSKYNEQNSDQLFGECSSINDDKNNNGVCFDRLPTRQSSMLDFSDDKNHVERTTVQLYTIIKQLMRENFELLQKRFYELDFQNTKRMTMDMLRKLLHKIGLKLSMNETMMLWESMLTDQHGTLEFQHFVRHFGYSLKSAAFPNAKRHPPIRGDSDFRVTSNRFNSWKDLIQGLARVSLETNHAILQKRFNDLDPNMTGFIRVADFKKILQVVCSELTLAELNIIIERMSTSDKIFWPDFMKHLRTLQPVSKTGHDMKEIMRHNRSQSFKGLGTIQED